MIGVFLLALLLHELGHYKMARLLDLKPEIRLEHVGKMLPNVVTVWYGGTLQDENKILKAGLVCGVIPVVFYTALTDVVGIIPVVAVWALYYFVCRSDVNQLARNDDAMS